MTCARVSDVPSFDDLVSPSTGLPLWVHSAQEYDAAKHRTAEVRRLTARWQMQVILAEVIRVFDTHPWVAALQLVTDGTRDGIVSGVSLRATREPGVLVPGDDAQGALEEAESRVFCAVCPYADEVVWNFADEWFDRSTHVARLAKALDLEGPDLAAFVERCHHVHAARALHGG